MVRIAKDLKFSCLLLHDKIGYSSLGQNSVRENTVGTLSNNRENFPSFKVRF